MGWFFFGINVWVQFRVNFSPNRPTAKSVCLCAKDVPGEQSSPSRWHQYPLSFTMASVPLKKITSRNVNHYDWQPRGAKLSFTMASVPWKKYTSRNVHHYDWQSCHMSGATCQVSTCFFFLQIGGGFSNVVLQEQDFVVSPYFPFTSSLFPGDHICSLMSNKPITFLWKYINMSKLLF